MSAHSGSEVGAQRVSYAELEKPNAFSNACNPEAHRPHLASLQLLVDIASRMPLEPLLAMSDKVEEREQDVLVTLPPLHDILCGLPIARTSSTRSTSDREDSRGKGGSRGGSESPPGGPSPLAP